MSIIEERKEFQIKKEVLIDVVESTLGDQYYIEEKVHFWSNMIHDKCMKELMLLEQSLKFVVSCIIVQRKGTGTKSALSCKFDNSHDYVVQVVFEGDESKCDMDCIITVIGVAI